jgi:hypothetical protein
MAGENTEKNPLDETGTAFSSILSQLLKIRSIKVNIDFDRFAVEIKTKEPPPAAPGSAQPSPQK